MPTLAADRLPVRAVPPAAPRRLDATVVPVASVDAATRARGWALFAAAYTGADRRRFESDFAAKQRVILLHDPTDGSLQGFSGRPLYWFLISKGYKTYLMLARAFPRSGDLLAASGGPLTNQERATPVAPSGGCLAPAVRRMSLDASVAWCARQRGHVVVASDIEDVKAVDPSRRVVGC